MALRALTATLSILALVQQISAQVGPDPNWLSPDGSKADFNTVFSAGNTVTLSWKALNDSRSDLWLTHWDPSNFPWYTSVAKNVDISKAGSLQWTIDVSATEIASDSHFVLRFFPLNAPYGILQFVQRDSPGFLLTGGTTSSSVVAGGGSTASASRTTAAATQSTSNAASTSSSLSSSSSTSPTSSTPTTSPSQTTSNTGSTSQPTTLTTFTSTNPNGTITTATITTSLPTSISGASQTTNTPSPSSLSVGAQVGIGVGAGVGIIILFIAGCFFGRRYGIGRTLRNKHLAPTTGTSGDSVYKPSMMTGEYPVVEAPSENAALISKADGYGDGRRYENSRPPRAEVQGNSGYPVEKGGAMIRPGMHEMS